MEDTQKAATKADKEDTEEEDKEEDKEEEEQAEEQDDPACEQPGSLEDEENEISDRSHNWTHH